MAPAADRVLRERQRQRRRARKASELKGERMRREMTRRSKPCKQMLCAFRKACYLRLAEVHTLNAPSPFAAIV
jgi:hypothetical protein